MICTPDDLKIGFWLGVIVALAVLTVCVAIYFTMKETQ